MNKKIIPQSRTKGKPAIPSALIEHVVKINQKASELQELTTFEALGKQMGMTKQGFNYHLNKVREGSK